MKTLPDEAVGKSKLRIVMDGPVYRGCVLRAGKMGELHEEKDLEKLRHLLREEAGKCDPAYWGFDAAIARFRSFNPKGFADPEYVSMERTYKDQAAEALRSLLPLEHALDAGAEVVAAASTVVGKTNLLAHQFEQQQLRDILKGEHGTRFAKAAATIALGDPASGFIEMTALEKSVGRISWPIATYLPFLWDPRSSMFLKPEVTCDFAQRVGHPFVHDYEAALDPAVYASLLDLARLTEQKTAALGPRDWIDVQSFIWVVGKYTDADRSSPEQTEVEP